MKTISTGNVGAYRAAPTERDMRTRSGRPTRSGDDRPAVLIVDDVPDNLLALEGMLRREDIDILTATSGRDALEILLERDVALAIVDVMMPEMDGFELAELIRGVERTRRVPIIFVTAASKADYRVFTGYQAGAIDFLFKPLDERVLRAKVDVLVTLARQQRDLDRAREQAEQAQRETEILLRLARATSQADNPEHIYDPALDAVRDLLGADRSAILLFDESEQMRFQAWRGLSETYRAAVDGHSPWTREATSAQPILISDVAADETMAPYRSIFAAERISAIAFVPLTTARRVLGKFMLYWEEPRTYSAHDEGLVLAIAAQVSEALDRAETQEALRLTESKLRAALAAGQMGVWEWHIPSGHVVWSPELQAIHGLEPGTFEGTFDAFQSDVHPDDRERLLRTVQETLAAGRDHQIEYRIVRPDGEVRWVAGFGKVLSRANGKPAFMTGVCFDITERKQAEQALRDSAERYRTLFEVSLYGVLTIDEDGIIETANPAAERTFGYSAADMVGRNVAMLMPEPYRSEHASYLGNYQRTGERKIIGIGREVVGQRKDGSQFPMDLAVSEFLVGGKRYFKGIVVDITERKQLEQAREAAIGELAKTLRYNEVFAGVLAHDLRNPLGAMLTAARVVLHRSGESDSVVAPLRRAVSSGERMARMIDQLLDFTKARVGGGFDLAPREADLSKLCRQVVDELELAHPKWEVKIEALGDCAGIWDPDRLAQVVANLVTNAGQHGVPGAEILIELDGTARSSVVLEVHNEGSISEALLPDLFSPFRATRKHGSSGLGLGIYIVREIVRSHGGDVDFTSTHATGTTFTVRLPRVTLPRAASTGRAAQSTLGDGGATQDGSVFGREKSSAEEVRGRPSVGDFPETTTSA